MVSTSRYGCALTGLWLILAQICFVPARAAAHEPVPEGYPQIEVERLNLTYLRIERSPVLLMGALTFVNPDPPSVEAGRLEFTVKQNGLIMLLASWDKEEGEGPWTSEVLTRKQLGQTWIDLGPASWDESKVLFIRNCKAGDRYVLRTCRDAPPLPILTSYQQLIEMKQGASTIREAMKLALRPQPQTPEEIVAWLAYGVPEGAAVIAANNLQLFPLDGENIPDYLQGAKIYRPVPSGRPGAPVSFETIEFGVRRAGPLYVMASWEKDVQDLKDDPAYQMFLFEWTPLGPCPWDVDYQLYFRNCEPGDAFALRTREGYPALPIVAPPVNRRAEARRSFPLQAEGTSAVAQLPVSVPEGGPLLDVQGMRLSALEGELIPDYLQGAVIYTPVPTGGDPYHGDGLLRFTVKRAGQVFLLVTWSEPPDYRWDEPTPWERARAGVHTGRRATDHRPRHGKASRTGRAVDRPAGRPIAGASDRRPSDVRARHRSLTRRADAAVDRRRLDAAAVRPAEGDGAVVAVICSGRGDESIAPAQRRLGLVASSTTVTTSLRVDTHNSFREGPPAGPVQPPQG